MRRKVGICRPEPERRKAALEEYDAIWARRYAASLRLWELAWEGFVLFLDYDFDIRHVVCTADAIESLNACYQRAFHTRGHFPTKQAAPKGLFVRPARACAGRVAVKEIHERFGSLRNSRYAVKCDPARAGRPPLLPIETACEVVLTSRDQAKHLVRDQLAGEGLVDKLLSERRATADIEGAP